MPLTPLPYKFIPRLANSGTFHCLAAFAKKRYSECHSGGEENQSVGEGARAVRPLWRAGLSARLEITVAQICRRNIASGPFRAFGSRNRGSNTLAMRACSRMRTRNSYFDGFLRESRHLPPFMYWYVPLQAFQPLT
jgi:hypothetical protein